MDGALELRLGRPVELDPVTLYRILRLRVEVFVVEQACPYPELDGRDLEPGCRWVWAESDGRLVGTLRLLTEADGTVRIGRVATAESARSAGVAGRMMAFALDQSIGKTVLLDAQSYLRGWYQRFGFQVSGPEFVEDGIAHLPMRREAPVN